MSTDSWNSWENIEANSSAQVRIRWPEMLSGPEVFLPCHIIFGGDDLSGGGEWEGMVARFLCTWM